LHGLVLTHIKTARRWSRTVRSHEQEWSMATWKQLYAQAMSRQGALQDVGHRCVAAANDSGLAELARRVRDARHRMLPLYVLCASLDAHGIQVPDQPRVTASDAALPQ
jgi:hypothetical protein